MAGLTLTPIRVALAEQIGHYLDDPANVTAYPGIIADAYPLIEVDFPDGDYVSYFETMGPNGNADILLEVNIWCSTGAGLESSAMQLDNYLSVGLYNNSSVVDAVMSDRTLGGLVSDCVALTAGDVGRFSDGFKGTVHVMIICPKVGAQP
jgi:hypothetical protein